MRQALLLIVAFLFIGMVSCSKKHHPASEATTEKKVSETKTVVRKVERTPTPKVITVDDRAAKKTPDGRMYYDLNRKRYWRNFNDGKYYLYNKSMYNDPAFKPH